MGQAFSAGIMSALPGALAGIGTMLIGLVNPVFLGIGMAQIVASGVQGAATASATKHQLDGAAKNAAEVKHAEAIAKQQADLHKYFLGEAKRGAYGPEAESATIAFAKAAAAGSTLGAAAKSAGLLVGWGSARDKAVTRAMSKHMTGNSSESSVAVAMGDPVHRAAALKKRTLPSAAKVALQTDADSRVHGAFMQKMLGGTTGVGRSVASRIVSGSVQSDKTGVIYATSRQ